MFLLVMFVLAQVFLSQALSGRDEALERLNNQISELANLLALEQQTSDELRGNVTQLSASLQESTKSRDALNLEIDALKASLAETQALLSSSESQAADNNESREDMLKRISRLESALAFSSNETAALRARTRELQDKLSALQAATDEKLQAAQSQLGETQSSLATAQSRLKETEDKSEKTEAQLRAERKVSEAALAQVALLNQQIAAMRRQLARISKALEASEANDKEQKAVILDLGKRLNVALAKKVEELSRFRSEFFGRLREALGNRKDVRVVGDRFVFQSEVLFSSGSADLGGKGQDQLAKLAKTILEIADKIPTKLPWILRVDGHTDRNPIATARFPSNWALSTHRALSVVNQLIRQGVPANRLAAAGFGEFQPLDTNNDEIAYRRNRRIEIKLTQR
ncbi:MAG: peptidoglycan -binding protein [Alphaproteobacteria bacterium]|nr:peptidoglycan -binding protein [Alphaproteobacteria bacterium]MBT4084473.1 peptidoglycan -binding protein [Alphaproteobacteria bacterium]MBT4545720.1 peptidoglycan -binding protein [Alphaproteobacteria bacterium]MBT7744323.1 peptidoglycan -binding protein [Alphaproteobacteria bacterium]